MTDTTTDSMVSPGLDAGELDGAHGPPSSLSAPPTGDIEAMSLPELADFLALLGDVQRLLLRRVETRVRVLAERQEEGG